MYVFGCVFLLVVILNITNVNTLECYVCHEQEHNTEKCLNTIKTCEQEEDVCLTEIKWASTPYWSQGAIKQFYVSKRCSTNDKCVSFRQENMPICTHIWYEDWKCSECCKGDRCNYYVFSGSSTVYQHATPIVASVLMLTATLVF